MKKHHDFKRILMSIVCIAALLLVNACTPADYGQMPTRPPKGEATTAASAPTTTPAATDGELSGELTITTLVDHMLKPAAEAFMELHPKISIQIESYPINQQIPEKTYAAQSEKFVYQTVTSLMSGTPSDLICLFGMPLYKLDTDNLFYDLYSFMDSDPDLQRDAFYENLLTACEVDGHLIMLPASIGYQTVNLNAAYHEDVPKGLFEQTTIDYLTMAEITQTVLQNHPERSTLYFTYNSLDAFEQEMYRFFDPNDKTVRFDQSFIDFMLQIEPWFKKTIKMSTGNNTFSFKPSYQDMLFRPEGMNPGNLTDNDSVLREGAWLLTNTEGEAWFTSNDLLAIPQKSQNPDLAWEFIKFITSPEWNMANDYSSIPIRIDAYQQFCEYRITNEFSYTIGVVGDLEEELPRLVEISELFMRSLTRLHNTQHDFFQMINSELKLFASNEKSIEDVAQTLNERLSLLLNE